MILSGLDIGLLNIRFCCGAEENCNVEDKLQINNAIRRKAKIQPSFFFFKVNMFTLQISGIT